MARITIHLSLSKAVHRFSRTESSKRIFICYHQNSCEQMKFPSTTAVLALVLALAVVSASAKDNNNKTYPAPLGRKQRRASQKTGLRRGGRRAQGAQQRAIICDAQGELSFVMVRGSARFVRGKSNYCLPPISVRALKAMLFCFPPKSSQLIHIPFLFIKIYSCQFIFINSLSRRRRTIRSGGHGPGVRCVLPERVRPAGLRLPIVQRVRSWSLLHADQHLW